MSADIVLLNRSTLYVLAWLLPSIKVFSIESSDSVPPEVLWKARARQRVRAGTGVAAVLDMQEVLAVLAVDIDVSEDVAVVVPSPTKKSSAKPLDRMLIVQPGTVESML
jgi:hypothetical protein